MKHISELLPGVIAELRKKNAGTGINTARQSSGGGGPEGFDRLGTAPLADRSPFLETATAEDAGGEKT